LAASLPLIIRIERAGEFTMKAMAVTLLMLACLTTSRAQVGAAVFSLWLALCDAGPASAQQSGTQLLQYCTALERGVPLSAPGD
jgi:hypothetical protein